MTWKLINLKVDLETLARIDAEAHRLGMTRTTYMIRRCDPGAGTPVEARPAPIVPRRGATVVASARPGKLESVGAAPFRSRLKGEWKAP